MSSPRDSIPPEATAVSAGTVARNTLWNVAGRGLPLVAALVAIPLQVKGFGTDRFGLLALFWIVAGYFGLFDMGVGRATTKFVADRLATKDFDSIPKLVWTSWLAMAGLGIAAGLMLAATVPLFVSDLLNVPDTLKNEATRSMYWLTLMLPLLITQAGLQGVLEARQRFDLINSIQIPAAILGYMLPLVVLVYTKDLAVVMAVLWASRCLAWAGLLVCSLHVMPGLTRPRWITREHLGRLLRFGGWLTVSNVVGPLMVNADRFLIGSLLTVSAVAYYATPYSLVTQLWIIPQGLLPVLFPVFCGMALVSNPAFPNLYRRTAKCVFLAMVPFSVGLMVLSRDLLTLWLGAEFARQSAPVLSLLAFGVLVNSLALVPYSVIQAFGRPDVTAKFHLLEVAPYLVLLWWCTREYGIVGTAAAWVLRVTVDATLLFAFAGRLMPARWGHLPFLLGLMAATGVLYGATTIAAYVMPGPFLRVAAAAAVTLLAAAVTWKYRLTGEEEAVLRLVRARLTR